MAVLPHDCPPWTAVYQQALRWNDARAFESAAHDLRQLLRLAEERNAQPTAAILDGRTLQSTLESGGRAGFDGHKKKRGSKAHLAIDTLGHVLALVTTPANEQERAQVAFVDQGYTGQDAAQDAEKQGIRLESSSIPRRSEASSSSPDDGSSKNLRLARTISTTRA